MPGMKQAFEELISSGLTLTSDVRSDINGLIKYLGTFECVLMASIWLKILTMINYRSTVVQAQNATINVEADNIESLITELKDLRNSWGKILEECKLVAYNIKVSITFPEKRQKIRKRFSDETPDEVGTSVVSEEESFKRNVFYVILDTLIGELTERFQAVKAINEKFQFLWMFQYLEGAELIRQCTSFFYEYKSDVSEEIIDEIKHLKHIYKDNLEQTDNMYPDPLSMLNMICKKKLETLFPNICIALRIFCSIPVSVASAERAFSVLARIKNFIRSTSGQERTSDLGTLCIEADLARKLNFNPIIDSFANAKARKANL